MRFRLSASLLTLLLLAACAPEPLALPDGALVACEQDSDCPAGWACSPFLERCISADASDRLAPQLAVSGVLPALGRAGTTFIVTLQPNEPLGRAPVAWLALPGSPRVPLGIATARGEAWEFGYTATGQEGASSLPVEVQLVDRWGNAAELRAAALALDLEGPGLQATRLRPEGDGPVGPAALVTVAVVTSSDTVRVDGALHGSDGGVLAALAISGSAAEGFAGMVDLGALELAGAASLSISLSAEDAVGNRSRLEPALLLPLDARAPAVAVGETPDGFEVSPVVEFTADEPSIEFACAVDGAPIPCAGPTPAQSSDPRCTGGAATCGSVALGRLALGAHTFSVAARDPAGNQGDAEVGWNIVRGWRQVSAGGQTSCAVATDDTLWCWGSGEAGQLADGATGYDSASYAPVQVFAGEIAHWRRVAVGGAHVCAIAADASLWCWGARQALALEASAASSTPRQLGPGSDWAEIAAGATGACGIRGTGPEAKIWCWGSGLPFLGGGAEPTTSNDQPTGWTALALGDGHLCALREQEGGPGLWCGGLNGSGQLGTGDANLRLAFVEVAAPTGSTWRTVAAGSRHTCAADSTNALWCWGDNGHGQLGLGDGEPRLSPARVPGLAAVESFDLGPEHSCALSQGATRCWGRNDDAQVDLATREADALQPWAVPGLPAQDGAGALAAGEGHVCLLNEPEASLSCWGRNARGQLGHDPQQLAAPETRVPPGLAARRVGADTGWIAVAVGDEHTCAVREARDGRRLYCWGSNARGQTGTGRSEDSPALASESLGWQSVAAGARHNCAMLDSGKSRSLWCWGENGRRQSGQSTVELVRLPSEIQPPAGTWEGVPALGDEHSCALGAGSVWCWGGNDQSQIGGPSSQTPIEQPTAVGLGTDWTVLAAGANHTCGLRTNGEAWCWGANNHGQAGLLGVSVPTVEAPSPVTDGLGVPLTDWTSLTAGQSHTCGMHGNTPKCWGSGGQGQLEQKPTHYESPFPLCVQPGCRGIGQTFRRLGARGDTTCGIFRGLAMTTALSCWGAVEMHQSITLLRDPVLAVGRHHGCALAGDLAALELWCWGEDRSGSRGLGGYWLGPGEVSF